jgi:hypothetical protein
VLYCCLSLSCLLIAASTTYGLGGFLRYQKDRRRRRRITRAAAARASAAGAAGSGAASGAPGSGSGSGAHGSDGEPEDYGGRAAAEAAAADSSAGPLGDAVEDGAEWHFFQPFSGGTAFVAAQVGASAAGSSPLAQHPPSACLLPAHVCRVPLFAPPYAWRAVGSSFAGPVSEPLLPPRPSCTCQAIGWSLFSAAIVLVVIMLQQLVAGVASCVRCWAVGAGSVMVAAQAVGAGRATAAGRAAPLAPH